MSCRERLGEFSCQAAGSPAIQVNSGAPSRHHHPSGDTSQATLLAVPRRAGLNPDAVRGDSCLIPAQAKPPHGTATVDSLTFGNRGSIRGH